MYLFWSDERQIVLNVCRKTTLFYENMTNDNVVKLQSFIIKLILIYKSLKDINQSLGAIIPEPDIDISVGPMKLRSINSALCRNVLLSIKKCKLLHTTADSMVNLCHSNFFQEEKLAQ